MLILKIIFRSAGAAVIGVFLLAFIYFLFLAGTSGDWRHPGEQFFLLKYWMGALFLGFGLQVGLFWYIRITARLVKKAKNITVVNAGVSTTTMITCCAHHITEVAPMLGLSALTIFLAKHQVYILMLAIIFNIAGIFFMINIIRKHKLYRLNHLIVSKV